MKRRILKYTFAAILCLSLNSILGQVYYSVNPLYIRSKTESNNLVTNYSNNYPDTSIAGFHNYFPRNFSGNLGLPSPEYVLKYGSGDLGFRFYNVPTIDRFNVEDITYNRTMGPFADFTGIAGSKELQIFKMLFTHTYRDKINLTLRFNRYTSKGFYVRQQTYANNFYLSSNYTTRRKRAGYYLYVLNNGNKNAESGGIRNGILTEQTLLENKEIILMNLNAASRDNRENKFMLNPWLRLNRSDSTGLSHYLQLKSTYSGNIYHYRDAEIRNDKFYQFAYLDSLRTNDSSHVRQLGNEISYCVRNANNNFAFSAGYKNETNRVWQVSDSLFFNHIISGDLVFRLAFASNDTLRKAREFITAFRIQHVPEGANKGDHKAEYHATYNFNADKKRIVFLNFLAESRHPDFIYNTWNSNHFRWFNNGYKSQRQVQIKAGIKLGNSFSFSAFYQDLTNILFFDTLARPGQSSGSIKNRGLHFNFTRVFFKHLGISVAHVYQNTSDNRLVRIPQNVSTSRLFYSGALFKNNLYLQTGLQLQLYEAFTPYAYTPAIQAFHLQNDFQTETYPFLDLYLNARIRPVSIFLKVENILQGYAGTNYAFVPGYYQPDRAFRFGISWLFFD